MTSSRTLGSASGSDTTDATSCSSSHTSSALCEELRRLEAEEAAIDRNPRHCWLKVKPVYDRRVLVGNWFNEAQKIDHQKNEKMLPSDYDHYYGTTYKSVYEQEGYEKAPIELKNLESRHSHAYPCHQPELDTPLLKAINRSWETTNNASYCDPLFQIDPSRRATIDTALFQSLGPI